MEVFFLCKDYISSFQFNLVLLNVGADYNE